MKINQDVKLKVLQSIPHGKENAISRDQFIVLTGYCDRTNRNAISHLRREGKLICSDSVSKGYWIADDIEDAEVYINEMLHRSMSIMGTVSRARKELKKLKKKTASKQDDLF